MIFIREKAYSQYQSKFGNKNAGRIKGLRDPPVRQRPRVQFIGREVIIVDLTF